MGLRINTNVASVNAQNNLRKSKIKLDSSLEKLSSGARINKAADDAAGLAISENLRAEIRGTKQATRNANDGVSLIQVAEGGLNEISNILIRLRELSIQASSDTVGAKERQFIDIECQQMKDEIQRIASVTRFNDTKLLNGEGGEIGVQIGISNNNGEDRIQLDMENQNASLGSLEIDSIAFVDKGNAQDSMQSIDNALMQVNGNRANLGAVQNRLQSTINNLHTSVENLSASNARIRDVDVAVESSELTKNAILQQSGVAVLSQANLTPKAALALLN